MCPFRPSVTLAVVLPQGPGAAPLSSVAEPQFAFTWRDARFSSTSTESLSYGVLLPACAGSLGAGVDDPPEVLDGWSSDLPPPELSLDEGEDGGSSDEWLSAVPGESAGSAAPPHATSTRAPNAPTTLRT